MHWEFCLGGRSFIYMWISRRNCISGLSLGSLASVPRVKVILMSFSGLYIQMINVRSCRSVLIACVGSYFVLMGILTLYTTFKEKGIFAVAYQKEGTVSKTWQASSEMKKWVFFTIHETNKKWQNLSQRYDDQYTLTLTLKDSKGIRAASITKSCASYIDNNGVVLENLIANEVGRLYNSLNSGKKDK